MSDSSGYLIPSQAVCVETAIKRSRFIAQIAHVEDKTLAEKFIIRVKMDYPDARHHCWAYIACAPNSSSAIRFNDDGEPSGTAGKPILNILQHSGVGEIICVVSRYFGGVKLGAGGLVRAYSNSTKAALEQLITKEKVQYSYLWLQFDYAEEAQLRFQLEKLRGEVMQQQYQQQVSFSVRLPTLNFDTFITLIEKNPLIKVICD